MKWPDNLSIDYDKNYGIDKQTGWSISVNGSVIVQFERFLLMAIIKTIIKIKTYSSPEQNNVS